MNTSRCRLASPCCSSCILKRERKRVRARVHKKENRKTLTVVNETRARSKCCELSPRKTSPGRGTSKWASSRSSHRDLRILVACWWWCNSSLSLSPLSGSLPSAQTHSLIFYAPPKKKMQLVAAARTLFLPLSLSFSPCISLSTTPVCCRSCPVLLSSSHLPIVYLFL